MLLAMSEPYADHVVIDGDIFDEVTDVALTALLAAADRGDAACAEVWTSWLVREGHETYAYMTIEELLTSFAVNSADSRNETVLMPINAADIIKRGRDYYNRFLAKQLANPLTDAKQLVLFQNVPLSDTGALRQALEAVQDHCGKPNLARIYTAINSRG
jgi:hypothetical protein